jgi:hypothetical protein
MTCHSIEVKNNFTANGFERWLNGRATARRKTEPAEPQVDSRPLGFLDSIRRWRRVATANWQQTKEIREKSSGKILW